MARLAWVGWHPSGMHGGFCIASGGVASLNRSANGFDASGIGTVIRSLAAYWEILVMQGAPCGVFLAPWDISVGSLQQGGPWQGGQRAPLGPDFLCAQPPLRTFFPVL